MLFPTVYDEILSRVDKVDPVKYAGSRNYTSGDVTMLSPYISRGVISTKEIVKSLRAKDYTFQQMEKLVQQMAWREYFQRTWEVLQDNMLCDIRRNYTGTRHRLVPKAILCADTVIDSIDSAIHQLYQSGYMHNHLRMYIASIACNIGKSFWQMPSQWMYYHLLDGDIASNVCSWQWVAGSFSSRQYYCNQENINRFTGSQQRDTFLDRSYEELPLMDIPHELKAITAFDAKTVLPATGPVTINTDLPLMIYNSYNLDPTWRQDEKANRILLLSPWHFRQFPVSEKVIRFILDLAKNIEGIQVFTGEVTEIPGIKKIRRIYSKAHPAFTHYPGKKDAPDWLFPTVSGSFPSFFAYWKKCLRTMEEQQNILANPATVCD